MTHNSLIYILYICSSSSYHRIQSRTQPHIQSLWPAKRAKARRKSQRQGRTSRQRNAKQRRKPRQREDQRGLRMQTGREDSNRRKHQENKSQRKRRNRDSQRAQAHVSERRRSERMQSRRHRCCLMMMKIATKMILTSISIKVMQSHSDHSNHRLGQHRRTRASSTKLAQV